MQATINIPENYSFLPKQEKMNVVAEEMERIQLQVSSKTSKQNKHFRTERKSFPKFKPIKLRGEGLTASEMVTQARKERQETING